MRPRSLRAWLLATVLALLAVACTVSGVATVITLRWFMIRQLDDDLRSASLRFQHSFGQPPPSAVDPGFREGFFLGPAQAPRTLGATLENGAVVQTLVTDRGGTSQPVNPAKDSRENKSHFGET
ncbi:MAG: hypothetical protein H0X35_15545 [Pseudonocardiales bacterium]|nr:hypothetical protein [Pseudonocardiales bacterium]